MPNDGLPSSKREIYGSLKLMSMTVLLRISLSHIANVNAEKQQQQQQNKAIIWSAFVIFSSVLKSLNFALVLLV